MEKELREPNPQRSCTSRTIKLSTNAQEAKIQAKHASKQNSPPTLLQSDKVEKLIIQLTRILSNWDKSTNVLATQYKGDLNDPHTSHAEYPSKDLIILLATKVCSANAGDLDQFVCST